MTDKSNVFDLVLNNVNNMEYHPLPKGEKRKISIIQEIIERRMET
jgi:hypothetical protein